MVEALLRRTRRHAVIASGMFGGLPLVSSLGGTGAVLSTGAKSRWANVHIGIFVALLALLFARLVDLVAMPASEGVLIVVGAQTVNAQKIQDVWDASFSKRTIMVVTFLAMLVVPVVARRGAATRQKRSQRSSPRLQTPRDGHYLFSERMTGSKSCRFRGA